MKLLALCLLLVAGCEPDRETHECLDTVYSMPSMTTTWCGRGSVMSLEIVNGNSYMVCRCHPTPDAGPMVLDHRIDSLDQHIDELNKTVTHFAATVDAFVGKDGGQ